MLTTDEPIVIVAGMPLSQRTAHLLFNQATGLVGGEGTGVGSFGEVRRVEARYQIYDEQTFATFAVKRQRVDSPDSAFEMINEHNLHQKVWQSMNTPCKSIFTRPHKMQIPDYNFFMLYDKLASVEAVRNLCPWSSRVMTPPNSTFVKAPLTRSHTQYIRKRLQRQDKTAFAKIKWDNTIEHVTFDDGIKPVLYTVQQWGAHRDMSKLVQVSQLDPNVVEPRVITRIAEAVGHALNCLHRSGVVHNDAHHGNVLVNFLKGDPDMKNPRIKLIDLGHGSNMRIGPTHRAYRARIEQDLEVFLQGYRTAERTPERPHPWPSHRVISEEYKSTIKTALYAGWFNANVNA